MGKIHLILSPRATMSIEKSRPSQHMSVTKPINFASPIVFRDHYSPQSIQRNTQTRPSMSAFKPADLRRPAAVSRLLHISDQSVCISVHLWLVTPAPL